jgi:hypothetical protein
LACQAGEVAAEQPANPKTRATINAIELFISSSLPFFFLLPGITKYLIIGYPISRILNYKTQPDWKSVATKINFCEKYFSMNDFS